MKKFWKQQSSSIDKPWVNYYDEGVPKSFDYPDVSIWEFLYDKIKDFPSKLAYEYYGTSVSFKRFSYEIEEAARALKSIGVLKGDIVTIVSANVPQAIVLFYAVNMVGAIANMVHPLSAQNEILYYLTLSKSKYVFVLDVACEKVMNVVSETNVLKVVVISASEKMNPVVKVAYNLTQGRKIKINYDDDMILSWKNFLDFGYMYDGDYKVKGKGKDPAIILYSGGTTGKPKGIVLGNLNLNAPTMQTCSMMQPVLPGDTILTIMPIFHAFGLDVCVHSPLTLGLKCILIPVFNYKKFGRLIKQYKPNYIVGVPTLLETMINDPGVKEMDLSFIKDIITGGDTVSAPLKSRVDEFMKSHGSSATVRAGYGLTEGSGPSALMPRGVQPPSSIGLPCQDMLYKIEDTKTGESLPYGEEGEICISGPNVMLEYLNDKEETDKALVRDKDGILWLHTGDIGKMDSNGFVYFSQRLKRIIISSGYNLYPSHIEDVIDSHYAVQSSCVIGVPHPYKTQVAKAFIVLNPEFTPSEELKKEIKNYCKENLAKYSVPYEYEFRDSFPRTMVGKVAYKELEKEEEEKRANKKSDS